MRDLDALTTNASASDGRPVRAFNRLARNERMLFEVLLAGEYALHGFTNRDVRQKLGRTSYPLTSGHARRGGSCSAYSNGAIEGLNRKIRTITRRAYGFHSASSLISLIFLCCTGLTLHPVFKTP